MPHQGSGPEEEMRLECEYEGCTVGETGRCALENDPATCPNRIAAATRIETNESIGSDGVGDAVLEAPEDAPSFPLSTTLGLSEIDALMARRHVTVVGILGDPESGKTACLASLYLMASRGVLKEWSFADSRSLMGFEGIARGARTWNQGRLPEQMTVHTEMADDRQPGFLHLRLKRTADGRRVDFALPDLPGEWTKSLITNARIDRFEFLRSAEVLWLMVDGKTLRVREKTQGSITRLGQLVGRLVEMIGLAALPKLLVVVSHRDAGAVSDTISRRIQHELEKHGAVAEVVSVASFADPDPEANAQAKPGEGIEALINATVSDAASPDEFWPSEERSEGARSYILYRAGP